MTNSEKIKAYLDAGHKVRISGKIKVGAEDKIDLHHPDGHIIIAATEYPDYYKGFIGHPVGGKWSNSRLVFYRQDNLNTCEEVLDITISIHQEPIRYPKVGSKVVVLDSFYKGPFNSYMPKEFVEVGKTYTVCDVLYSSCSISVNDGKDKAIVDYRHLAPYIE